MLVLRTDLKNPDEKTLKFAAEIIREGGLVAFPTETVYGLGADALNSKAVRRIFEAKGRPADNPLIVHISDFETIEKLAFVTETARKLMKKFFPGPLTLVLKKRDVVPDITTGRLDTVAIRMPDHQVALKLIELSGTPIAAPSANISGKPSPTKAEHVIEDFSDKIECVIDGGETKIGLESTVVDARKEPVEILRPGAVTAEELSEVVEITHYRSGTIRSPGMKYRHYSPKAELIVLVGEMGGAGETEEQVKRKVIGLAEELRKKGFRIGLAVRSGRNLRKRDLRGFEIIELGESIEEVAKRLFSALRELDRRGVDVIIAEGVEEKGLGTAIMNRLKKAGRVYRV
jgi:L-threonylcarbamoyladenylate synthase